MNRSILALALLVLPGAALLAQPRGAPVVTATVAVETVSPTRDFLATTRPQRRVTVNTELPGLLASIAVEEGQLVTEGTELARLRPELKALAIASARAELEVARKEVQTARDELAELKNGSRPDEIRTSEARLLAAEVKLTYRRWLVERGRKLRETNAITEEEYEEWRFEENSARAALEEAKAQLQLVREGPRQERRDQAKARLARAEANEALQLARVTLQEEELKRYVIKAPFTGVVTRKLADAGQYLERSVGLVEMIALDPLEIEIPVPEADVATLRPAMELNVKLRALGGEKRKATLFSILPEADAQSRTVPVRLRLPNSLKDGRYPLRAGLSATVALPVAAPRKATLVPKDALVLGGPTPLVYVFKPAPAAPGGQPGPLLGQAVPIPVKTGLAVEDRIIVFGPLQAGQLVVVEGNERLRPMQPVMQSGHLGPAAGGPR